MIVGAMGRLPVRMQKSGAQTVNTSNTWVAVTSLVPVTTAPTPHSSVANSHLLPVGRATRELLITGRLAFTGGFFAVPKTIRAVTDTGAVLATGPGLGATAGTCTLDQAVPIPQSVLGVRLEVNIAGDFGITVTSGATTFVQLGL